MSVGLNFCFWGGFCDFGHSFCGFGAFGVRLVLMNCGSGWSWVLVGLMWVDLIGLMLWVNLSWLGWTFLRFADFGGLAVSSACSWLGCSSLGTFGNLTF